MGTRAPYRPPMPTDLLGLPAAELLAQARTWFGDAKGAGAAVAIHRDAVRTGEFAPERHGLGPRAAAAWRAFATLALPSIAAEQREATPHGPLTKRLLRLADGLAVESVHLPMGRGRSSLCLSTQVGCARGCTFCETGRQGLLRNLSAAEITAQVTLQHRQRAIDADDVDALCQQGQHHPPGAATEFEHAAAMALALQAVPADVIERHAAAHVRGLDVGDAVVAPLAPAHLRVSPRSSR